MKFKLLLSLIVTIILFRGVSFNTLAGDFGASANLFVNELGNIIRDQRVMFVSELGNFVKNDKTRGILTLQMDQVKRLGLEKLNEELTAKGFEITGFDSNEEFQEHLDKLDQSLVVINVKTLPN